MFCDRCTYFMPCRGCALLRRLRLGWCFHPGRFAAGLARHGHAPFRAGWCPCCGEFLDLNNSAPRSGAGGHPHDERRGIERRGAAASTVPEAPGVGSAQHDPARHDVTPRQPRTETPGEAPEGDAASEAHAKPKQSRDAAAGPAQREGRIDAAAWASNGAPEEGGAL